VGAARGGGYREDGMGDRLKDKVALVSGAGSSGPGWRNGKATAVLFAREGAKVLAADLNLDAAVETKRIIESEGGICLAVAGNVSRADDVAAIVDARTSIVVARPDVIPDKFFPLTLTHVLPSRAG
jgi:NAD(P)-dependent dehydrogenase (short-subunit alcohol dehydrogenase family)